MRALATGAGAVAVVFGAVPASAHVTVHADNATPGATDVAVTFRTPNEDEHASTVELQVFFPTTTPALDVLVQPHPGWAATVQAGKSVTWTATSPADALHPGQSADFVVTVGKLPDAPAVTFKALQTYSNGNVVRWISVAAPGAPEPERPAPILQLRTSSGRISPIPITSTSSSDGLGRGLGIAALVVALLALAAAVRPRRR
jgi:uncharacterized protein